MPVLTAWLLLLAVVLLAACAVFVAAEFAFVTVDRASVERDADTGDASSIGVLTALRSLSTQLSGAQLGITLTNLGIGYLAQPAISELVDGPLGAVGVPRGAVPPVAVAVGLVLATAATTVFGELVPKNVAIADTLGTARRVQRPMRLFTLAARPAIAVLNGSANVLVRRLGVEPQEELASARSASELSSLVRRSAEQGTLESGTADLLERSLAFGDMRAEDVLTPRVRVEHLSADAPVLEVIHAARRTGHSRFLVSGRDLDDVVGVVHVKHAVGVPADRRASVPVRAVMVSPVLVPASLELDPLLETLRRGGLQMAVVVDEFGGTDGIVTLEDLVEELVGDVRDEHDRGSGTDVRPRRSGGWSLSGLLRPDEIEAATEVELPASDAYETLGGLMAARLGKVPTAGEQVEVAGVRLVVERMEGRRVDRVLLERLATGPAPDQAGAA